jgi:hypothetical protein
VLVEDRLFATLDATTRRLDLPGGESVLVTDTVGFITKLPHGLVEAFRSTLQVVTDADLCIHVVDGSGPDPDGDYKAVTDDGAKTIYTAPFQMEKIEDAEDAPTFNEGDKVKITDKSSGFYDLNTMRLQSLTAFISRDLHCWQMSINVTPIGLYRYFNITINPKSGLLRDLKVNRTRYFYTQ